MEEFDLIVIGAGPGGYVAAIRAAQLNMNVAIIEKEHLGGVCLNWGCIPTKTLLKSSEINHLLNNISEYGFTVNDIKFDLEKIVNRSRNVANQLSSGIKHLLKKNKVRLFTDEARLIDKNNIELKNENIRIKFKFVIIATGARAKTIPNLEYDSKLIWTYKEAMVPDFLPKTILVIGSGAIGIEFASFYHNMGVKVTILELEDRILCNEDEEISKIAYDSFTKQGIEIYTLSVINSIKKNDDSVTVSFSNNNKLHELTIDRVISAIGIIANTENLGLENTAVTFNKNHIVTNEYLETNEKNIYAIGDVTGAPWLAHKASHEAIICVEHIAGLKPKPLNINNIPACTYSTPQIATIGLSEKKAIDLGYSVKIGRFPFKANGRAIAIGEPEGLIKTIYDKNTGELLGAHMIGAEVTEMIQGFAIMKNLEGTEIDIAHTIFPHPTLSEMMHESTLDADDNAIHI